MRKGECAPARSIEVLIGVQVALLHENTPDIPEFS